MVAEQKYNRGGGAGVRGCKPADYLCEASMCEGQKLEGAKAPLAPPPPSSAALGSSANDIGQTNHNDIITMYFLNSG